jgi:hypothetical protein
MLPKFSNYKEEGKVDQGYEALQDFFMSWTLRCSLEKHAEDNLLLNEYAKKILFALLFGNNQNNEFKVTFSDFDKFKVIDINTKRQFKRIDLLAEINVEYFGKTKKYILNIENKWYSNLGYGQLANYKKEIEEHYDSEEHSIVNVVIYTDEEKIKKDSNILKECQINAYKLTNIDELKGIIEVYEKGETGNYLFDEFWIR